MTLRSTPLAWPDNFVPSRAAELYKVGWSQPLFWVLVQNSLFGPLLFETGSNKFVRYSPTKYLGTIP